MAEPDAGGKLPDRARKRIRAGWVLTGLGIAAIAWAALYLAGAASAGSGRTFETRPTYDRTKERAQGALLGALARGLPGLALVLVGARLRSSADERPGP